MHEQLKQNAVAAIRVSTTKQGIDGDSPEAQKEQIERFAENKGVCIKKYFVFLESASKEQQPIQEAIDYCKDPKNNIQLLIIKSIDRFTRGGSDFYGPLKRQLEQCGVNLVDIYGIIGTNKVNTLEHLGFEYKWSVYSPTQKSEILEAERSKDELRDIMSRMIGAEIRYTQMGFWMHQPPYGFISEKLDTRHGKRCVLKPHPIEAQHIIKMFELRAQGALYDKDIVAIVNTLGYKTRMQNIRSKQDQTKIIGKRGGKPLTVKAMQKFIRNSVYAGVNEETWTGSQPVQCAFEGLVSIDLFNRANHGKRFITENEEGDIAIHNQLPPLSILNRGKRNSDFPYRKFVTCSQCHRPLLGSSSRGKNGKHYPAYHCSNHGHYYRVPKQKLEDTIAEFIGSLKVSQDHIDTVISVIEAEWQKRQQTLQDELQSLEGRINELKLEAKATVDKIKVLSSETAIKYMEEDIMRIEKQISLLTRQKAEVQTRKPIDFDKIMARIRYLLENLDELLIKQIDPIKKAQFFGAIFDKLPSYEDLKPGNLKSAIFTGINPIFSLARMEKSSVVRRAGIEPARLVGKGF